MFLSLIFAFVFLQICSSSNDFSLLSTNNGSLTLYGSVAIPISSSSLYIFGGSQTNFVQTRTSIQSGQVLSLNLNSNFFTNLVANIRPSTYSIGLLLSSNSILLYGGTDFTRTFQSGYIFSTASNTFTSITETGTSTPPASFSACGSIIYNSNFPYFVQFGGNSGPTLGNIVYGELFIANVTLPTTFAWKKMTSVSSPSSRMGASMVSFDSTRTNPLQPNCIIMLGGQNSQSVVLSDVWMACPLFSSSSVAWNSLAPLPTSPSMYQQAILVNQRILVWGGFTNIYPIDYLGNILEYNIALNSWNNININLPSSRSSSIFVSLNSKLYIYGGLNRYQTLSDLWVSNYQPLLCAVGSFFNSIGTSCSNCLPGSYSNSLGSYSCSLCNAGSWQSNSGSTSCNLCPLGTWNSNNGSTALSSCTNCIAGTYNPNNGSSAMSACVTCPATMISAAGSSNCSYCSPGYYVLSNTCTLCGKGSFSSSGVIKPCSSSIANYYIPYLGATNNTFVCPVGFYSLASAQSCTPCPLGQFNGIAGYNCSVCTQGSYSSSLGSVACTLCLPGTYSNTTGSTVSTNCKTCGLGTYSPIAGGSSCFGCGQGTYQNGSSPTSCFPCPLNYYSSTFNATSLSTCLPCGANYVTESVGSTSAASCILISSTTILVTNSSTLLTTCPANQYYKSSISSCQVCPLNQYSMPGWSEQCIYSVSHSNCPFGPNNLLCSGKGSCNYGFCVCNNPSYGNDCSLGDIFDLGVVNFASSSYLCQKGNSCLITINRQLGSNGTLSFNLTSSNGVTVGSVTIPSSITSVTFTWLPTFSSSLSKDQSCQALTQNLTITSSNSNIIGLQNSSIVYIYESNYTSRVLSDSSASANVIISNTLFTYNYAVSVSPSFFQSLDILFLVDVGPGSSVLVSQLSPILPAFIASLTPPSTSLTYHRFGLTSFDGSISTITSLVPLSNNFQSVFSIFTSMSVKSGSSVSSIQLQALSTVTTQQSWCSLTSPCQRIVVLITSAAYSTSNSNYTVSSVKSNLLANGINPLIIALSTVSSSYSNLVSLFTIGASVSIATTTISTSMLSLMQSGMALVNNQIYLIVSNDIYSRVLNISPSITSLNGSTLNFGIQLISNNSNFNNLNQVLQLNVIGFGISKNLNLLTFINDCSNYSLSTSSTNTIKFWTGWVQNPDFTFPNTNWAINSSSNSASVTNDNFGNPSLVKNALLLKSTNSSSTNIIIQTISTNFVNALPLVLNIFSKPVNVTGSTSSSYSVTANAVLADGTNIKNAISLQFVNGSSSSYSMMSGIYFPSTGVTSISLIITFSYPHIGYAYFTGTALFLYSEITSVCSGGFYVSLESSFSLNSWILTIDGVTYNFKCKTCPPNYYCINGAQIPCPNGTYSFGNAASCLSCPIGWSCVNGIGMPCGYKSLIPQYYNNVTNTCANCLPGYQCSQGILQPCPDGAISVGSTGLCTWCFPGTYSSSDHTQCLFCQNGFYSNYGRSYCQACPYGLTSSGNGTMCYDIF